MDEMILLELYKIVVYNLRMCMKKDCSYFKRDKLKKYMYKIVIMDRREWYHFVN